MPELPEVETIVRQLRPHLLGREIESAALLHLDMLRSDYPAFPGVLHRQRIGGVDRAGKCIRIALTGGAVLSIHLGMSGRLTIEPAASLVEKHTHFVLRLRGQETELRLRDPRRFGGIWYEGSDVAKDDVPDALDIRVPVLRRLCKARRQIKALLMDQHTLAGLGNIYCDESLHAARIHPAARAASLGEQQIRSLACSIRKTLRAAIAAGGSTLRDYVRADGRPGEFQFAHRVYGRRGQPCRKCHTAIEATVIGSRTTSYCPRCQPLNSP